MVVSGDSPDNELIQACKEGDMEAFRCLFEKYQGRNYSVAYGMLRNREDALEVSQESFIKAFKSIRSFRGKSSFGTWLFRITTNKAIDFIRRNKRHRTVEEKDWGRTIPSEMEQYPIVEHIIDPGEALARKQLREELELAMSKLPPKQRAVVILREVEGLSYQEISRILGCPKGTVMSRLHGARSRLRGLLKGRLEE